LADSSYNIIKLDTRSGAFNTSRTVVGSTHDKIDRTDESITMKWDPIELLSNQEDVPRLASPLMVWWTVRRLAKQKQQVGPGEVFGAIVTVELTQRMDDDYEDNHWLSPVLTKAIAELLRKSFEPKQLTISQLDLRVIDVSGDNQRLIWAHFYVA